MEEDCIFCRIVRGEAPAEVVYRGESVLAFKDVKPHAPVHILIVPKSHIRSVNDLTEAHRPVLSELFLAAREIAKAQRVDQSGYKLIFNVERGGGQLVFHLHLHLVGGW
jgi:histidine triad (HIT) family protein